MEFSLFTRKYVFIVTLSCVKKDQLEIMYSKNNYMHKKGTLCRYLGPADITEQLVSVQNSVMVPYSMLIWLKKSTAV